MCNVKTIKLSPPVNPYSIGIILPRTLHTRAGISFKCAIMKIRKIRKPLEQRFWSKVDKSGGENSCWNWTAFLSSKKKKGSRTFIPYGKIRVLGKYKLSHRVSWELHFGAIPNRSFVLHKCDNSKCVNPAHLELGDQSKNMKDCFNRKRICCGEKRKTAKLNDEKIKFIKENYVPYKRNKSGRAIAKLLGVNNTIVSGIIRGKRWRHLL